MDDKERIRARERMEETKEEAWKRLTLNEEEMIRNINERTAHHFMCYVMSQDIPHSITLLRAIPNNILISIAHEWAKKEFSRFTRSRKQYIF